MKNNLSISAHGLDFIISFEGEVLHVYDDGYGYLTAGVGHLLTPTEKAQYKQGDKITKEQSRTWLKRDLAKAETAVIESVTVPITQNQYDALVSFTFNLGTGAFKKSSILRNLNNRQFEDAADAILKYNKAAGKVSRGLSRRREAERKLFLTPNSATAPAVSTTSGDSSASKAQISSANPSPTDPPPITTSIEQTKTEATTSTGLVSTASETKVSAEIPKGDPPEAAPVKVSKNQWFSHVVSAIGGSGAVVTAVWGWMGNNLNAVGIGLICLTLIILALMFRKAILDAIRMQTAADPDKRNVT